MSAGEVVARVVVERTDDGKFVGAFLRTSVPHASGDSAPPVRWNATVDTPAATGSLVNVAVVEPSPLQPGPESIPVGSTPDRFENGNNVPSGSDPSNNDSSMKISRLAGGIATAETETPIDDADGSEHSYIVSVFETIRRGTNRNRFWAGLERRWLDHGHVDQEPVSGWLIDRGVHPDRWGRVPERECAPDVRRNAPTSFRSFARSTTTPAIVTGGHYVLTGRGGAPGGARTPASLPSLDRLLPASLAREPPAVGPSRGPLCDEHWPSTRLLWRQLFGRATQSFRDGRRPQRQISKCRISTYPHK